MCVCERETERESERETDRQAGSRADRQADRQTDRKERRGLKRPSRKREGKRWMDGRDRDGTRMARRQRERERGGGGRKRWVDGRDRDGTRMARRQRERGGGEGERKRWVDGRDRDGTRMARRQRERGGGGRGRERDGWMGEIEMGQGWREGRERERMEEGGGGRERDGWRGETEMGQGWRGGREREREHCCSCCSDLFCLGLFSPTFLFFLNSCVISNLCVISFLGKGSIILFRGPFSPSPVLFWLWEWLCEAVSSPATLPGCPRHENGRQLCRCNVCIIDRLVGLVVRRQPRERKIPGSNPACDGIFSGSSHTSELKICTPVATLPGAWRYRVSAGTGRPGVSIL